MSVTWIAHRGNRAGTNPELENRPDYVLGAIEEGFQVEVDLWWDDGELWLGHDSPQYKVDWTWLIQHSEVLWVHCKNLDAVSRVSNSELNWFFHDRDEVALTAKGFLWCYPGIIVQGPDSVLLNFTDAVSRSTYEDVPHFAVCADTFHGGK